MKTRRVKIRLDAGQFGWDYIVSEVAKPHRSYLIQTDWDYIPWAETFGCRSSKLQSSNPTEAIHVGGQYLDDHIGKVVLVVPEVVENFTQG